MKELKLKNLTKLDILNASYCSLSEFSFVLDDPNMNSLKNLNLSFNKFTSLPVSFFEEIVKVENLNLANNLIEKVSEGILNLKNLGDLNVKGIRRQAFHKREKKKGRFKGNKNDTEDKNERKKSNFAEGDEIPKLQLI